MFVRFRNTNRSLIASLCATRRIEGEVKHEHIATLAGFKDWTPGAPAHDRAQFWKEVHRGLSTASDKLDDENLGQIVADIHTLVPLPSLADQSAEAGRYSWWAEPYPVFAELGDGSALIDVFGDGPEVRAMVKESRALLPARKAALARVRQAIEAFADRTGLGALEAAPG